MSRQWRGGLKGVLQQLVWSLPAFTPTRGVLRASGLGLLVHDKQVWESIDNQSKVLVNRAELKWRAHIKREATSHYQLGVRHCAPAFGCKRPHDFLIVWVTFRRGSRRWTRRVSPSAWPGSWRLRWRCVAWSTGLIWEAGALTRRQAVGFAWPRLPYGSGHW